MFQEVCDTELQPSFRHELSWAPIKLTSVGADDGFSIEVSRLEARLLPEA